MNRACIVTPTKHFRIVTDPRGCTDVIMGELESLYFVRADADQIIGMSIRPGLEFKLKGRCRA